MLDEGKLRLLTLPLCRFAAWSAYIDCMTAYGDKMPVQASSVPHCGRSLFTFTSVHESENLRVA